MQLSCATRKCMGKNVLLTIPVIWTCHQPFALLLLWLGRMTLAKSSFNEIFATLWYIRDTRLHIIWCIEALEEICKYRILCRSRYYELRKCEKQKKKSDCIPPRNLKLSDILKSFVICEICLIAIYLLKAQAGCHHLAVKQQSTQLIIVTFCYSSTRQWWHWIN